MAALNTHILPGLLVALLLFPCAASAMDPQYELDVKAFEAAKSSAERDTKVPAHEAKAAKESTKPQVKNQARSPAQKKKAVSFAKREGKRKARQAGGLSLRLMSSSKAGEGDGIDALNRVWDKLVPAKGFSREAISINNGKFVLSLDPDKYPVLPAADGGKILIDPEHTLPALVKSLLTENEQDIRVVSENPRDRRLFVRSVLGAAKFFSVQENFSLDFGTDPKLVVNADYKIEKTADSLLQHDMVLLNVDDYRSGMPNSLLNFLKNKGFQVVEAKPARIERPSMKDRQLYQITAREPQAIADSLMSALSLRYDRDKNLHMWGFSEQGITLQIKADRYFEESGERFVVSIFNGDPVSYTLVRLMETSGYKVIILDDNDDLRTVAEKFISRMRLSGYYGTHSLWQSREMPYNVEMSGVMISDANRQRTVMMTNRTIEPLTRELAELNGYSFANN